MNSTKKLVRSDKKEKNHVNIKKYAIIPIKVKKVDS
jgi:hypothetical protein